MRTRAESCIVYVLAMVALACGGEEKVHQDGGTDAGAMDAGTAPPDGGESEDASVLRDAGSGDAGVPCDNQCPLDALQCVGNTSEQCLQDENGCLQWVATPCGTQAACMNGLCTPTCPADNVCGDECCTSLQACISDVCCNNPCGSECCSSAETCTQGVCVANCESPCNGVCCTGTQVCMDDGCCTPCGNYCCAGSMQCGTDMNGDPACVNPCISVTCP